MSESSFAKTETTPQQIAGVLREPLVRPLSTGDGVHTTYHWETPEGQHTFLYLTLRRDPEHPAGAVAQTNVDSEEVRGQGDAIWSFMGHEIQRLSDAGAIRIVHEVHPNEYSRRLPMGDPRYETHDGGVTFIGTYTPQPQQPLNEGLVRTPHEFAV